MRGFLKFFLVFGISFLYVQNVQGQEETEEKENEGNFHRITVVMGNTHVPEGAKNEGREWLILTSWGLDYDFWFNNRWAIGLHTDAVLENFEIESREEETIVSQRSRPISLVPTGLYKPGEHLTLMVGAGIEIAKEENLTIIRAGIEYGWELPAEWEIGVSLMNDFKLGTYNSWTFGLGVSKKFFSKGKNKNE